MKKINITILFPSSHRKHLAIYDFDGTQNQLAKYCTKNTVCKNTVSVFAKEKNKQKTVIENEWPKDYIFLKKSHDRTFSTVLFCF